MWKSALHNEHYKSRKQLTADDDNIFLQVFEVLIDVELIVSFVAVSGFSFLI